MRVCAEDAKPWEFLRGYPEVTKCCEANDEKSRRVSTQSVYTEHTYTRVSESLIVPWSASEFLSFCAVVAKLTRSSGSNTFAAFIMCTMLLAHTSWKGLTFYKCKRQLNWTVEYYNRIPSISASLWILQSVSPPGLRFFQQQNHRRRLLNICVLYLLTIDSDAALVSTIFEITHSSIFEPRWLLPVWLLRELRFFCCCTHTSSSEPPNEKYDTQTTQKSYPRGVQFYE